MAAKGNGHRKTSKHLFIFHKWERMGSLRFIKTYFIIWCRCQETLVEKGTRGQYQGARSTNLFLCISAHMWTGSVVLTKQKETINVKVRLCAANFLNFIRALHTHTHHEWISWTINIQDKVQYLAVCLSFLRCNVCCNAVTWRLGSQNSCCSQCRPASSPSNGA